ncbi:MAG: hypothetical protein ABEJ74_05590 [Haloferacaceae archaeon]
MAGRYGNVNFPKLTKRSFLFGLALFVVGAFGQIGLHAVGLSVPGWEQSLLFDAEVIGVIVALLSPFVFGILLPLTD